MKFFSGKKGFSFVEIIIALFVSIIFLGGLIYFASTTRVETSKAGNYLRALQIAQETIELIQSVPVKELSQSKIQLFEGSLVDPDSRKSVQLPFHADSVWQPQTKTYPEQYTNAWFYRKIKLEPVENSFPNSRFMQKIVVEVYWNEGKAPDKIESIGDEPDRMRKLALATIVFDEGEVY